MKAISKAVIDLNAYLKQDNFGGENMIARIWHGKTKKEKGEEYLRFLVERALPDYKEKAHGKSSQDNK